tara:strand:- start:334 stop:702 length:369 start_codon:yes stop_codon:yes gene_type:complete
MDSKTKEILQKFSAQRVDLALELGGIKSMSNKLKGDIKAYNKKFSVLDDLVRDLSNEAQGLDKRAEKFYQEVQEVKKSGQRQAKELGVKFENTPIGKEVNSIETSVLVGDLETIKKGLKLKI